MKEIVKEYPIVKLNCSNILQLYRFPSASKTFKPVEVKFKPTSKLTEVKIAFPTKCASALKLKNLNSENVAYRAFPSECKSHYYARIENDTVVLYTIQNTFLFQPYHFYYPFDYTPAKLKKAESREEFEHRMRSINFKLKNVEMEGFRVLGFELGEFDPKNRAVAVQDLPDLLKYSEISKLEFKEIEETIKRTRIVNMHPLSESFKNEDAIKSSLFKMTERLEGRFVLKNSFYERNVHEIRTKLLDLFRSKETVKPEDVQFLKKEKWLIDEIATFKDGFYELKGFRESFDFDGASIKAANLSLVKDLLRTHKILSATQISNILSLNEDMVCELLDDTNDFFHLSNNSFALNDESYILNNMYGLLVDKKSFEMSELTEKLEQRNIEYNETQVLEEIRKFCIVRAGKFYLKIVK